MNVNDAASAGGDRDRALPTPPRVPWTARPGVDTAYRFCAIFLAEPYPDGAGRPDLAVKLLKKGVRARPERWQYPHTLEPGSGEVSVSRRAPLFPPPVEPGAAARR